MLGCYGAWCVFFNEARPGITSACAQGCGILIGKVLCQFALAECKVIGILIAMHQGYLGSFVACFCH